MFVDLFELISAATASAAAVISGAQAIEQTTSVRREKAERSGDETVARRLLYGEVLFNLFALQAGSTVQPPRLAVQDTVYRGLVAGRQMSLVGDEDVAGEVGAAYAIAALTATAFAEDWLKMAVARAKGVDSQVLESLALQFRQAEQALRPIVWTRAQQEKIAEQLAASNALLPLVKQPLSKRLQSVGLSVPDTLTVAAVGFAAHDLSNAFDRWLARRRQQSTRQR